MKRTVICVSALVLWCLVGCTFLAGRIEELMTVSVVMVESKETLLEEGGSWIAIPGDALVQEEDGPHLYSTRAGEGWETGLRIEETDPAMYVYEPSEDLLRLLSEFGGTKYVHYASKPVRAGELAMPTYPRAGEEDCYLILDPGTADQSLKAWETASVLEEKEGLVLVTLKGKQPFLQGQARGELGYDRESRLYSLGDVRGFFGCFPKIAGMLAAFFSAVLVWAVSLRMVKDLSKNRLWLAVHGAVGIGLCLIFRLLLDSVCLPSSLLPADNILDIAHYRKEFQVIFQALESCSADVARETLRALPVNLALSAAVLVGGTGVTAVLLAVERRIVRINFQIRSKKEGKSL